MTTRAFRRRAASTTWRESAQLQGRCRHRFYARRRGFSLFVLVIAGEDGLSRVWARLDDPRTDDVDVSGTNFHDVPRGSLTAKIRAAKAWCEREADLLSRAHELLSRTPLAGTTVPDRAAPIHGDFVTGTPENPVGFPAIDRTSPGDLGAK